MRARGRRHSESPSLFPFLAVLVCTMGALIVLLVVLVQQARVEASHVAEESTEPSPAVDDNSAEVAAIQQAIDDANWRADMLRTSHEQMVAQHSESRLQLSHLEDDIRRREDRIAQLQQQASQLQIDDQARRRDLQSDQQELAQLLAQQEASRRQLEQARQEAATRRPSFAVIPYDGPSGTQRRPIYIECRGESVLLQPEGVELVADDFRQPVGPHNALASALRAAREYLSRTGQLPPGAEPYPLLIVRPDGAVSYAAARNAMGAWDAEFGYELIEAEIELAYPPADPQLAAEVQRAVDQAREFQADLARAAPSRYGRGDGPTGGRRATRTGGFESVGGVEPTFGGSGRGSTDNGFSADSSRPVGQGSAGGTNEDSPATFGSPATGTGEGPTLNRSGQPGDGVAGGTEASGSSTPQLGGQRGANWALPNAAPGATGFTRPIRIAVTADQLIVLPERGADEAPLITAAPGPIQDSIDSFISSLWDYMDRWGTAGIGAYWKPVLSIEVAPGAEQRYEELARLLEGSGMDVTRRSP